MTFSNTTTEQFIDKHAITDEVVKQHLAEIVKAVRADEVVGKGTCSWIDEAHTDYELLEMVALDVDDVLLKRIPTVKQAVKQAREYHDLMNEREEDIRNA